MSDTTVVEGAPVIAPEVRQGMILNGIIPAEQKTESTTTTITPDAATALPIDIFQPFKDKFGYEKPEDALAEIEQLRALKANPPTPTIEFADAESEKLFKAWTAGKKDDVYNILEKSRRIDSFLGKEVDKDNAADLIKFGMQLKYKAAGIEITPDEINYKFNKQYGVPAKPTQATGEDQADYDTRISEWEAVRADKQMELMIDAKLAKPELEASKSKLVLPEIEQSADEGYLQYQKDLEENRKLAAEAEQAYKAFTPKHLETKINFKDESNKIDFDFIYEPDPESFAKTMEITSDINKLWELFYDQDGSPNRQKFANFVYAGLNRDKQLMEAMKQSKNATIKAMLPDNSNGGMVRQLTNLEAPQESELDKQMRMNGIRRAN